MSNKEQYGLKVQCRACKIHGKLDFHAFRVRITGALEFICPACSEVSIYIGRFGQDIKLGVLEDDVKGTENVAE